MKPQRTLPKHLAIVQLEPLPGAAGAALYDPGETARAAGQRAVEEAKLLTKLGFKGILLENTGDAPCAEGRARPETVAAFALIAAAVRAACPGIVLGVSLLEQDGRAAAALAGVVGADFIRVTSGRLASFSRFKALFCPRVFVLADASSKNLGEVLLTADAAVIAGDQPELSRTDRGRVYVADQRSPKGMGVIAGVVLRQGGKRGARIDAKKAQTFLQSSAQAAL